MQKRYFSDMVIVFKQSYIPYIIFIMKNKTSFLLAICLTGFFFRASAHEHNPTSKGFVVIELFTSEGCSSCPPADELVAKTQRESTGKPVYILTYHVDYWNNLGWRDAF